ncbi:hypothetical protein BH160DRAFT_1913 [Burkholderia sp. H160]|nr:hypothetical protein BH160DRAFT_1913 [Burkholderia sp. H160]
MCQARGHKNNGYLLKSRRRLDSTNHFDSIHQGHRHVRNDDLRMGVGHDVQRVASVLRSDYLVACNAKDGAESVPNICIVVYQ